MLIGIPQSIVILLTGLVYYAVDFWLMRHYDQPGDQGASARSWRYTLLMVAFWAVLVIQPVLLPRLGLRTTAWWGLAIQAVGLASILCGLALHWWARSHLKHFYVEDVRFLEGQYVVDTGPYGRVRHPVFTSFFLVALGMMLVNPALTTLAMVVYVAIDFTSAARQEEALLSEKLPEYAVYMQRTGRFIPRWRH
ncbi:MAG: methyltransferase family protein [Anaerolineae bacterium]|jgi:protein-S-isoprenylcysteine O-methyltransferase Ste14